jgi:hypothetical protein
MPCDCQTFFTNLNLSYLDTYGLILCGGNDSFGGFFGAGGMRDSRHSDLRCQVNETPSLSGEQKGVKFHPKEPRNITRKPR